MANYPGSLDSFTTKVNKQDDADAADMNAVQAAIVATQTELGVDVAGTRTDLEDRLAQCIATDGSLRKGTSFPASGEQEGDIFYRTDENAAYTYNGSTWVSFTSFGIQLYTSDDTWTVPGGVTKAYITMIGQGGGGGGCLNTDNTGAGGGSSGAWIVNFPVTVTPTDALVVQVGAAAGAGGASGDNDGVAGEDTIFDTGGVGPGPITCSGGNGGSKATVKTGGAAVGGDFDAGTAPAAGGYTNKGGAGGTGTGPTAGGGGGGSNFGIGAAGGNESVGAAGAANTGAGGGGAAGGDSWAGGTGGSGIVVILY